MASLSSRLNGKTQQKMDQNQSNLTKMRTSALVKLVKTSSKFTKKATLSSRRCKFARSYHLFQKLMGRYSKTIGWTTASLMASFSVQCQLKPEGRQLRHFISWPGRMVRCYQSKKTTDLCMSMTSTAICSGQNSILRVRRRRISKSYHHRLAKLYLSGRRTSMTLLARATTASTHSSSFESTKARTGPSSLSSTIRFRTLPGLAKVLSSSCSLASSLAQPLCTTPMANPVSSLPSDSETR